MNIPASSTGKIECPFAIKWEIEESKLVALKDSENGYLETDHFYATYIPGVEYYFRIYPNGDVEKDRRGKVVIFFLMELGKQKKIKANFKFMIESAIFVKHYDDEFDEKYTWGQDECCTTEELFDPEKKYIVNGKLSLKCQGTLSVQQEIESADKKWEDTDVGKALWNRGDKDFTIVVDGNILQAHKYILAARSPVFEAMFNAKMKETTTNRMVISDLSYETVDAAIQLCYDRKISTLALDEKIGVHQFFDKYEILNLKDAIETSLIESISTSNVCRLANSSLTSNCIKLEQKCMDFLLDCVKKSQMVSEFDTLDQAISAKVLENALYKIQKS